MGSIEPYQGYLINGRGRTSRCLIDRTRQVKALHVVEGSDLSYMDETVGSYPMSVEKQGTNVTVYSN